MLASLLALGQHVGLGHAGSRASTGGTWAARSLTGFWAIMWVRGVWIRGARGSGHAGSGCDCVLKPLSLIVTIINWALIMLSFRHICIIKELLN